MHLPYLATARRSDVGELLDMVWRRGPELMRAGGGALEQECHAAPVSANEKRRIANLFNAGHSLEDIAADTGRHYSSIVKLTRHLREARGHGRKRAAAS